MMNGGMSRHRSPSGSESDDFLDDGSDEHGDMMGAPQQVRGHEPQPRSFEGGQRPDDRPQRPPHEHHRPHHRDRHDREPRGFPDRQERQDRSEPRQHADRQDRPAHGHAEPSHDGGQGRPRERVVASHEQPEFLRRPVRRPRREGNGSPGDEAVPAPAGEDTDRE
jgi:hypothetical protein